MKKIRYNWFTLIELLVSITIFSIMMIAVVSIYVFYSNLAVKIEINRVTQENVKNMIEIISEDIRQNKIKWVSSDLTTTCSLQDDKKYKKWTKLCISDNTYYLAKDVSWTWVWVSDIKSDCSDITSHCVLVRNHLWEISPLTNSFVSFRDLKFYVSKENIPKITLNFIIQPSSKKWVKIDLIKNSKMIFQTTISERLINTK